MKLVKDQRLKIKDGRQAFTLLEALISIVVLSLAIAGAFSIAPEGFAAARFARNQITASYLAQEALEVVRNRRDNGMYWSAVWEDWTREIEHCIGKRCVVNALTNELIECDGDCPVLKYNEANKTYGNGAGFDDNPSAKPTIFTRVIQIKRIIYPEGHDPADDDPHKANREVEVTVLITWEDLGGTREIRGSDNLLMWWMPGI